LAEAIVDAGHSPLNAELEITREREEKALEAESLRLRQRSLRQAEKCWDGAMCKGTFLQRALKKILHVHCYPEYMRRVRRRMAL
jgi:hypothetical protein